MSLNNYMYPLPHITNTQGDIIYYLYVFRFLNRIQIQKLLNHKNKKTINVWLQDLRNKQYINWIYSTDFAEKTKPAVYYLGLNGIRWLKFLTEDEVISLNLNFLRTYYREKDRSQTFTKQCQLIADICLTLEDEEKKFHEKGEKVGYSYQTASELTEETSHFHFLTELKPHLLFSKNNKGNRKYYLLELFEPTLPRYSIRKRIRTYMEFYEDQTWESHMKNTSSPKILLALPTKALMIYAKRYTRRLFEEEEPIGFNINFTFEDEIKKYGITGQIWEEVKYEPSD